MRRAGLLIPLLLGALLAGCSTSSEDGPPDPGFDPDAQSVDSVRRTAYTVTASDGTAIPAIAWEPVATGAGSTGAVWPVVVFVHPWGGSKEGWEGREAPEGLPETPAEEGNTLRSYAQDGFVAIAYDARGFGESQALSGVAAADELSDLAKVVADAHQRFRTTGRTGLVGYSYGAGQSLLSADLPVQAIVASAGWTDLYDALLPGDVPKLEWAQTLYTLGVAGTAGKMQPYVTEWYASLYTREGLDGIEAQMDARSAAPLLEGGARTAPLLLCQGMQDTLFPQVDQAWRQASASPAPVHAVVTDGGHGTADCAIERRAFLHYHLLGRDTGVGGWPALRTVDAAGGVPVPYDAFPDASMRTLYLRAPDLAREPNAATFTVEQRFAGTPVGEPNGLWDALGRPNEAIPAELRQDPGATVFRSPAETEPRTLLGAPRLHLHAQDPEPPFQVTANLLLERAGSQTLLSRAAAAALTSDDLAGNTTLELAFPWVKAQLQPGDRLVLEVGANEPQAFMPLLADYTVTFGGASSLELPFWEAADA